jgi:hypothetical protein
MGHQGGHAYAFSLVVHDQNIPGIPETVMEMNFDIFKRLRNGKPLWITSVPEIEEARQRVHRLEAIAPGEYLIYSQSKGIIVEYVSN